MDIAIIGAGPVGCYTAYLLAKKGFNVMVFEKKKKIGEPVQCTGLLTSSVEEILDMKDDFLVSTTNKIRAYSPNKNFAEINAKEFIIDRTKFDLHMAEQAQNAGANISLEHSFIGYKNTALVFKNTRHNLVKNYTANIIIGADGPLSQVAKQFGFNGLRRYYYGIQAVAKTKCPVDTYSTYFGKRFPEFFGWVVPEKENIARVGVASLRHAPNVFEGFLNMLKIKNKTKNNDIISRQSGLIPLYNPKLEIQKKIGEKNAYLVGDAALQAKATTGGGIVPGFKAAQALVYSIINNKNYQKEAEVRVGRELRVHLLLRQMLNRFNDRDYNHLISMMRQEHVAGILSRETRENPRKLMMKLILAEPRLLWFGRKLL